MEAHRGAVLSGRWSYDGTALVTGEIYLKIIVHMYNYFINYRITMKVESRSIESSVSYSIYDWYIFFSTC